VDGEIKEFFKKEETEWRSWRREERGMEGRITRDGVEYLFDLMNYISIMEGPSNDQSIRSGTNLFVIVTIVLLKKVTPNLNCPIP